MRLQPMLIVVLFQLVAPAMLLAHPGHAHDDGAAGGILHPLADWDHLLALIALGLWFASRLRTSNKSASPQSRRDARPRSRE